MGDQDHDGIPNRYDQDRDGDGRSESLGPQPLQSKSSLADLGSN